MPLSSHQGEPVEYAHLKFTKMHVKSLLLVANGKYMDIVPKARDREPPRSHILLEYSRVYQAIVWITKNVITQTNFEYTNH